MHKFLESPFSIEQYKQELDETEADMERGAFYRQEEVEKIAGDHSLEKRNQNPPVKRHRLGHSRRREWSQGQ